LNRLRNQLNQFGKKTDQSLETIQESHLHHKHQRAGCVALFQIPVRVSRAGELVECCGSIQDAVPQRAKKRRTWGPRILRNKPWCKLKMRSFSEERRQTYCCEYQVIVDALLARDRKPPARPCRICRSL
jgi:hypothetical protein